MAPSTSLLEIAAAAWVSVVGAAVGSFLNVVIARLPVGQSVVRPRSRCPCCGAGIAWYDNIPLLSWILLRARCRHCGVRISARYPLVEALGAGTAWLAWSRHGLSPTAAAEFVFVCALVALAFIDLDTWLLPNVITWPLIAVGLGASALGSAPAAGLPWSLSGAAVGFAAFALVSVVGAKLFRREALGFGDVWLLAGLGAWLGLGALLPVVLLASVQGSIVGIALILLGRATPGPDAKGQAATSSAAPTATANLNSATTGNQGAEDDWIPPKNAVPFGPFLVAAALEWLYFSPLIAQLVPPLQVFR